MSAAIRHARGGDSGQLQRLLKSSRGRGAAAGTDAHGWTALHWAASQGHTKCVQILLENRDQPRRGSDDEEVCDVLGHTEDLSGWTPLHCAAIGAHEECALALLKAGADAGLEDAVGDCPAACIPPKLLRTREGRRLLHALREGGSESDDDDDGTCLRSGRNGRQYDTDTDEERGKRRASKRDRGRQKQRRSQRRTSVSASDDDDNDGSSYGEDDFD